jgi:hypothetical protein
VSAIANALGRRRTSPVRFWLVTSLGAILLLVTLYLGTMTVLWGLHIRTLHADRDTYAELATERQVQATLGESDVSTARGELDATTYHLITVVDDKAQAEDLRYIHHDFALAFKSCAVARKDVLFYVERRYTYVQWQIHRYEDDVNRYCSKLKKSWNELEDE